MSTGAEPGAPSVAVIGVGNDLRGDDAAGLVAARALRERVPAGVDVLEREGEPTALLDAWAGAGSVVVIDAVASGARPGTLHRLDAAAAPIPARLGGSSTHAFSVGEAVELGRALDRLPDRLVVFGVEGTRFEAGDRMAPEVERGLERVVDAALTEVEAMLAGEEER